MSRMFPSTVLMLALAVAAGAQQNPIAWSVKEAPKQALKAGQAFQVRLSLEIPDGWHVYSITQPEGGPIPTRISIPDGQPFEMSGVVEGPTPKIIRDEGFGMDVETYEGPEAVFTVPVKVGAKAAPGKSKMLITAYFQSCDEKMCLPPRTVKLETELEVK
jgi:DsbC/DsbD-like thiol-disulfide interchange protein